MSRGCSNCNQLNSLIDEQKSKILLLETRLKDLVRAYKVVCKERDNFQQVSNSSVCNNVVDARQQKRIAELEESIIHMSSLCGKLELGRKQDQDQIKELQEKYEQLSNELNQTKSIQLEQQFQSSLNVSKQHVELRNNYTQTDHLIEDVEQIQLIESVEQSTQTDNELLLNYCVENNNKNEINKNTKNETAVVTPLLRNSSSQHSESEADYSSNQSFVDSNDKVVIGDHSVSSSGISLYHLNELARKELELADYRLRIREYECSLREIQWNYTNDKYKFQSRIADLELLNKNLMSSSNNEINNKSNNLGANNINVAYVKNVLGKLIETKDQQQRNIMINALITALDSMQTTN